LSSQPDKCLVMDSSVIIALAEIGMADFLLALDMEILVPHAVWEEVAVGGYGRPGSRELRDLVGQGKVKISAPQDMVLVEALHDPLGMGESEAIALAAEYNCTVVLDDRIARLKAKSMGLKVIGTIGLLRLAYTKRLISKDKLVQALKELGEHGFRISDEIINEVLKKLK
jgi:predicted nucleic acid-binding protein